MPRRNNRPPVQVTDYGPKKNEFLDILVKQKKMPHYVTINFDEIDAPNGVVIAQKKSPNRGK